jgi:hypothetical protein
MTRQPRQCSQTGNAADGPLRMFSDLNEERQLKERNFWVMSTTHGEELAI